MSEPKKRLTKEDPGYDQIYDPEYLTEDHSKHSFGEPEKSSGVDENGDEYDHSFRVENGKVSYEKTEPGIYLSSFRKDGGEIENRSITLDQLSGWFYNPTVEYYESVIYPIDVINE